MTKKLFFLLLVIAVSFGCHAESVEKMLEPLKSITGVKFVDMKKNPEYKKMVKELDIDLQDFHKTVKKFYYYTIPGLSNEYLDSLCMDLTGKAGLTDFYSESFSAKKSGNPITDAINKLSTIFEYVKAFGKKTGDDYTEFVYILKGSEEIPTAVVYVEGNLNADQLHYAFPKVDIETKIVSISED